MATKRQIRKTETGATRDTNYGKLEYDRYCHPLADYSYAEYMETKQKMSDGTIRGGDNWQKGLGDESLFESLVRHTETLKLLQKGYKVFECQNKEGKIFWVVLDGDTVVSRYGLDEDWEKVQEKTFVEELNAIRFNSEGLKLYKMGLYDKK